MMKNLPILLFAAIAVSSIGVVAFSLKNDEVKLLKTSILPSQENKAMSPEIDKVSNHLADKADRSKTADQSIDSPELEALEEELNTLVHAVEKDRSTTVVMPEDEARQIIQRSDQLIAQINQQYQIDTQHITALNNPDEAVNIQIPLHDPSFQKLNNSQQAISQDVKAFTDSIK